MMNIVVSAMRSRTRPAMAEPVIMAARDEVAVGGGDVRSDVTIGVTIWIDKEDKVSFELCRKFD
jgi:hypothetical protein